MLTTIQAVSQSIGGDYSLTQFKQVNNLQFVILPKINSFSSGYLFCNWQLTEKLAPASIKKLFLIANNLPKDYLQAKEVMEESIQEALVKKYLLAQILRFALFHTHFIILQYIQAKAFIFESSFSVRKQKKQIFYKVYQLSTKIINHKKRIETKQQDQKSDQNEQIFYQISSFSFYFMDQKQRQSIQYQNISAMGCNQQKIKYLQEQNKNIKKRISTIQQSLNHRINNLQSLHLKFFLRWKKYSSSNISQRILASIIIEFILITCALNLTESSCVPVQAIALFLNFIFGIYGQGNDNKMTQSIGIYSLLSDVICIIAEQYGGRVMNFTIRVIKIVIKILEYTQIKRVSYDRLEN